MVRLLEHRLICVLLLVDLFDCLAGAHVPALDPALHGIDLAISQQELVAARVQVIGDHVGTLASRPDS